MSISTERLRSIAPEGDPTRTAPISSKYAQRLRGAYGRLNAFMREAIADEDIFNLNTDVLADFEEPPVFQYARDEEKITLFLDWLERQEERGVLEVIGRDSNPFVRQAYSRAVQDADQLLNAEGVDVAEQDLQAIFNTPVHRQALQDLYTRNFEALADVNAAMNEQIS